RAEEEAPRAGIVRWVERTLEPIRGIGPRRLGAAAVAFTAGTLHGSHSHRNILGRITPLVNRQAVTPASLIYDVPYLMRRAGDPFSRQGPLTNGPYRWAGGSDYWFSPFSVAPNGSGARGAPANGCPGPISPLAC